MECVSFDFTDSAHDGLLISTREWLESLTDSLATTIDILLDVDGCTTLVHDFDEAWNNVWERFSNQFLEICNVGNAAILLFKKGVYEVCFELENAPTENSLHFSNLEIDTNKVYIAEGGEHIIEMYSSKQTNYEVLSLVPGKYELYYKLDKHQDESLVTIFFKKVNEFASNHIEKIAIVA